jgi:hypothetical protein
MYLNTSFCLTEARPPKKIQTQINSSGIESIEPASNLKLSCNSLTLSNGDHFICKFLKYLVVSVRIGFGKIAARYHGLAKPEMVGLGSMCRYYADKLPKTFTSGQLPVHHYQQLIPATKRLYVFISLMFHNNTLKCFLWEKFYQLCKNIFSAVHKQILLLYSKVKFQVVDICFLRYFASLQFVIRME